MENQKTSLAERVDETMSQLRENDRKRNERLEELELKLARQSLVKPANTFITKGETPALAEEDKAFLSLVRKGEASLQPFERKALVEDSTGQYLISPAIEYEL